MVSDTGMVTMPTMTSLFDRPSAWMLIISPNPEKEAERHPKADGVARFKDHLHVYCY